MNLTPPADARVPPHGWRSQDKEKQQTLWHVRDLFMHLFVQGFGFGMCSGFLAISRYFSARWALLGQIKKKKRGRAEVGTWVGMFAPVLGPCLKK